MHRDLKTPNVVISAEGRAKVLDFGLARRLPSNLTNAVTRSSDAVTTGGLAGTVPYMPPEVLLGQAGDERSDIWALGVTLFEMATGELPFKGRNEFELTAAILRSPPQALPAHVPAMVRGVIQRCLAKDPAHRYQRAGETRAALEAIQSDVASDAPALPPPRRTMRWRSVAAAAALVALAGAGIVWMPRNRESVWQRVANQGHLSLAVASDTPVYDPAISPDGKLLGYVVEDADGRLDLYVRRVSGGAPVKLTDDSASERLPRFSPDGERIAYSRRSEGGPPEIRIVPSLGGDALATIAAAGDAVWSSNGRELAFMRRTESGATELAVASADGSNARGLLQSDSAYPFLRQPAWSPDGRELAIVRGTGGIAGEIWIVPTAGGPPRRLFTDDTEVFADSPAFTPDGFGLIHSSNRGGATNLWLYPLDGGPMVRLTTGPGPDTDATVTTTGQVAFINSRWRNALQLHGIDGNTAKTLVTHSPFLWSPAFSPDGREIAFSRSEVDGSWHIWSVPVEGGTAKRLTASDAGEVYPRYAPDGASLLFYTWGRRGTLAGCHARVDAPEMLAFGGSNDAFPDLSPDGPADRAHTCGQRRGTALCRAVLGRRRAAADEHAGSGRAMVARRAHDCVLRQSRLHRRRSPGLSRYRTAAAVDRLWWMACVAARWTPRRVHLRPRRWEPGDSHRLDRRHARSDAVTRPVQGHQPPVRGLARRHVGGHGQRRSRVRRDLAARRGGKEVMPLPGV